MGELFQFPAGVDSGLPPARRALDRNRAEARGLEGEVDRLQAMKGKLALELVRFENAGAEVNNLLNAGAQTLLDKLRLGIDPVLSSLGNRAAQLDERRAASAHSAEICRRAIVAIDAELETVDAKLAELDAAQGDLILQVIDEAVGGSLRSERAVAIDNLREVLTRQAALARTLQPQRHDFAPTSRVAVQLPSLTWSDMPPEEIVLAPDREIRSAMAVLEAFRVALESDVLAAAPSFAPVDPRPDEDTLFHELSAVERARITKDAVHTNHQRPETPETRRFADQILDAARSAIGL
jgi:hypothetical protein